MAEVREDTIMAARAFGESQEVCHAQASSTERRGLYREVTLRCDCRANSVIGAGDNGYFSHVYSRLSL